MDFIDGFLDGLTSYRLVLYFLMLLLGWAVGVSLAGNFTFGWAAIVLSAIALTVVCRGSGEIFSRLLGVPRNRESDYITALILSLILTPAGNLKAFLILAAAGLLAIASKYLLTIGRRHIFNPAAFGAYAMSQFFNHYPSWWVGTKTLAPLVFLGGLLIMRKMRRYLMVGLFMIVYLGYLAINASGHLVSPHYVHILWIGLISTPVMFFAYVMLSEPLTSPATAKKYLPYAVLVSLCYSVTRLRISPEGALLIGNSLAYLLDRGQRLEFRLVKKLKQAEGIYGFVFSHHDKLKFQAGQYLEWTLPDQKSDSRGNRRYLTVASSPTEPRALIAVRIPKKASRFKRQLADFQTKDVILASRPAGSFTLPRDAKRKLAFIAGGIGVTPFRSIAKYLIDSGQKRDIVLFYAAGRPEEFAFGDVFEAAAKTGLKTIYTVTDSGPSTAGWGGHRGGIEAGLLKNQLGDWRERTFYVSGPYGFVKSARSQLLGMGVSLAKIKSDYFPGYG